MGILKFFFDQPGWIKDEYNRYYPPPKHMRQPAEWGTVTNQEIYTIMPSHYTDKEGKKHQTDRRCYDSIYRTIPAETFELFLKNWKYRPPDDPPNAPDTHPDCDDRAIVFWGDVKKWVNNLACGSLVTLEPTPHMQGVFIDCNVVPWKVTVAGRKMEKLERTDVYEWRF